MLRELYIENFVLIDRVQITPGAGVNVFTGETGAGKSMIIDALGLLTGERGRSDLVRPGAGRCLVEGVFDWPTDPGFAPLAEDMGLIDEEGTLILSREITGGGKSTARVNGRTVPLVALRHLGSYLLNIHAQEDTQDLQSSARHLYYLDLFDPALQAAVTEIKSSYETYRRLQSELEHLRAQTGEILKERDYLEFQIDEISRAGLSPGEEEELTSRYRLMKNASLILQTCQEVASCLYSGAERASAYDQVITARRLLGRIDGEPGLSDLVASLDEVGYALEEIRHRVGDLLQSLDFEPGELEMVEERLHQVNRLLKKYGGSSAEVLHTLEDLRARLAELESRDDREQQLTEAVRQALADYDHKAVQVSELRREVAARLEEAIESELSRLAMPHARFRIELETIDTPGPHGNERAVFLFSDNPGQELRPLNRIASGGELSRLALAFKVVFARHVPVDTFVFDEIDTGMSGHALGQIASRIAKLALNRQVLLVTHAPAVAAFADRHFLISKQSSRESTITRVEELPAEQIIEELARMMGDETALTTARQYARELRHSALSIKSSLEQG